MHYTSDQCTLYIPEYRKCTGDRTAWRIPSGEWVGEWVREWRSEGGKEGRGRKGTGVNLLWRGCHASVGVCALILSCAGAGVVLVLSFSFCFNDIIILIWRNTRSSIRTKLSLILVDRKPKMGGVNIRTRYGHTCSEESTYWSQSYLSNRRLVCVLAAKEFTWSPLFSLLLATNFSFSCPFFVFTNTPQCHHGILWYVTLLYSTL